MFTLPEDLTSLSTADLDSLLGKAREYATNVLTDTPDDVSALSAAKAAFDAITSEKNTRAEVEALRAEVNAAAADPVIPKPVPVPEPASLTATTNSAKSTVKWSTLDSPAPGSEPEYAIMRVAPDVPGMSGGHKLNNFSDAVQAVTNRLKAYPQVSTSKMSSEGGSSVPAKLDIAAKSFVRHGAVMFERHFPEELTLSSGSDEEFDRVMRFATSERRLPGGSLVNSVKQQIDTGKALTAAVGWCSPSEVIYNLCDLSSLDGLLDLPEILASRGGFLLPANGGPDFSVIWNGLGNAGNVVLTEYDVENGSQKNSFEIPCPPFEDVRLEVAYASLTGSLLQRRTYPGVVELFVQQALKALAHKINAAVIQNIVAASGTAIVVPPNTSGEDAASGILAAIDLAMQDIRYKERMARDRTVEVVLPYWAIAQIKAAMSRRYGIGMLDVDDAMIMRWFADRNAMPDFVYDWQDPCTGLSGGPGGTTPLTALPTTVQFLIYPSGTWTKIVNEVVALDTVYDSTLLKNNQYIAIFVEDAFNVIQTCPVSRLYTAQASPNGVVGCCP